MHRGCWSLIENTGNIQHRMFRDLPSLIRPHDLLVLNETRVIPAKLTGHFARRPADAGKACFSA